MHFSVCHLNLSKRNESQRSTLPNEDSCIHPFIQELFSVAQKHTKANFEKALKNLLGPLSGPWQALIRKGPYPSIRIGPRRLFVNGGTEMLPCFDAF